MVSVFLIHIASLMSLPALSDSRSITLAFAQSITWFSLQTWSVIAHLLQILAALVFAALVKIPVILSTSVQCFLLLLPVAFLFLQRRHVHSSIIDTVRWISSVAKFVEVWRQPNANLYDKANVMWCQVRYLHAYRYTLSYECFGSPSWQCFNSWAYVHVTSCNVYIILESPKLEVRRRCSNTIEENSGVFSLIRMH